MRIVSLLPAATEIVSAMGLQESLIAVSHECNFPPAVTALPKLTHSKLNAELDSQQIDQQVRQQLAQGNSLYTLDATLLAELEPDIIITQSLCEVCAINLSEVHQTCQQLATPPLVIDLNPQKLNEMFSAIERIGRHTDHQSAAATLIADLKARIARVQHAAQSAPPLNVLMLEWIMPPFSAGHWNPELIRLAGGVPVLAAEGSRSTELTWDQISQAEIDLILCACCGFDSERTAKDWLAAAEQNPTAAELGKTVSSLWALDGSQYFNRAGPRLVDSLELIAYLLAPDTQQQPESFEAAAKPIKLNASSSRR